MTYDKLPKFMQNIKIKELMDEYFIDHINNKGSNIDNQFIMNMIKYGVPYDPRYIIPLYNNGDLIGIYKIDRRNLIVYRPLEDFIYDQYNKYPKYPIANSMKNINRASMMVPKNYSVKMIQRGTIQRGMSI